MDNLVSINLVVLNGEKYIRHCLDGVLAQTFDHGRIAMQILDNGSIDGTQAIIQEYQQQFSDFHHFEFIQAAHNRGMWGGQEELWQKYPADYAVVLSVDVIMDGDYVKKAVEVFTHDASIGAIQGKTYRFDINQPGERSREIIDSCGFKIFRSRRVINIGHGERDHGQYDTAREIFGVEGAVPVFRQKALETIRICSPSETSGRFPSEIADHDLFWYAEDLDVAWRIRLAGWKEWYEPTMVAWHDRQTTKRLRGSMSDFRSIRREIPLRKRRLEWRNIRFTIIKNDYIINVLKDLPWIIARELAMTIYLAIFEPGVLKESKTFLKLLPRMLRKRRQIMREARVNPDQIRKFFA